MRALLVIPMAIFEVVLLVAAWVVSFVHAPTAKHMVRWSIDRLPGPEWYGATVEKGGGQ